jgi:hypothetical protein
MATAIKTTPTLEFQPISIISENLSRFVVTFPPLAAFINGSAWVRRFAPAADADDGGALHCFRPGFHGKDREKRRLARELILRLEERLGK